MSVISPHQRLVLLSDHILLWIAALVLLAPTVSAQTGGAISSYSVPTPRPINPATNTTNPSTRAGQRQNPFNGSTPADSVSPNPLTLTLTDAIQRGLRYNLGLIDAKITRPAVQAARLITI